MSGWQQRTEQTPAGERRYWERDKGGGVVERAYMPDDDGVFDRYSAAQPLTVVYGGPTVPRPSRSTRPRTNVVFTEKALEQIRDHARLATGEDGAECGGVLEGYVDGDRITVVRAFRAELERTPRRVLLDDSRRSGQLDGTVKVGGWHSHPGGGGPSGQDRRAWDRSFRHARPGGLPCWVEVIADVHGRFTTPTLHAWAVDLAGARPIEL